MTTRVPSLVMNTILPASRIGKEQEDIVLLATFFHKLWNTTQHPQLKPYYTLSLQISTDNHNFDAISVQGIKMSMPSTSKASHSTTRFPVSQTTK